MTFLGVLTPIIVSRVGIRRFKYCMVALSAPWILIIVANSFYTLSLGDQGLQRQFGIGSACRSDCKIIALVAAYRASGGFGSDGTLSGQVSPTTYNEGQLSTTEKCFSLEA